MHSHPTPPPNQVVNIDAPATVSAALCRCQCVPRAVLKAGALREALAFMGHTGAEGQEVRSSVRLRGSALRLLAAWPRQRAPHVLPPPPIPAACLWRPPILAQGRSFGDSMPCARPSTPPHPHPHPPAPHPLLPRRRSWPSWWRAQAAVGAVGRPLPPLPCTSASRSSRSCCSLSARPRCCRCGMPRRGGRAAAAAAMPERRRGSSRACVRWAGLRRAGGLGQLRWALTVLSSASTCCYMHGCGASSGAGHVTPLEHPSANCWASSINLLPTMSELY